MPVLNVYKRAIWLICFLPFAATAADRVYYIAADPVIWDYVPSGKNLISGTPFTAAEVGAVITACVDASLITHAAIRLPATSACRMVLAITDAHVVIGVALHHGREEVGDNHFLLLLGRTTTLRCVTLGRGTYNALVLLTLEALERALNTSLDL